MVQSVHLKRIQVTPVARRPIRPVDQDGRQEFGGRDQTKNKRAFTDLSAG